MSKKNHGGYSLAYNKKNKAVELLLYGVVGYWNFSFDKVVAELDQYDDLQNINVSINTIGGSFYHGLAIYNYLKNHSAFVTVNILGYALSMGSLSIFAANKVTAARNSLIMIHRAQGGVWGDAAALRKGAERLEVHEEAIIPDYQLRLGKSKDEVLELLKDETWYTAEKALKAGLIDEITDPIDLKKATKQIDENKWEECIGEHCNMPAENREFIKNTINPPSLIERIWGKQEKEQDEIEMTEAELKELLEANNKKITAAFSDQVKEQMQALKSELQESGNSDDENSDDENNAINDLKAQLKEKEDELAQAKDEIAALSKPEGKTETEENTGAGSGNTYEY